MRVSMMITLTAPLAVALMAAPALAHGPHGGGACRQDLHTYCSSLTPTPDNFRGCLATLCGPDFTPGPGAFASCLPNAATSGKIKLSDQCTAHLTKMQAKIAAFQGACGSDVTAHCSDVSGPRAVFRCLHQQQDLSESCKEFLAAQHHGHHHHHAPDWAPGSEQGNP